MTSSTVLAPVDWSLMLGTTGAAVEGLADVAQAVTVILTTPLRSDPHRPDFGCDLQPWIDMPVNMAGPGIVAAVRDALEKWEKRLVVLDVTVAAAPTSTVGGAGLEITVTWMLAGSIGATAQTTVAIGTELDVLGVVP